MKVVLRGEFIVLSVCINKLESYQIDNLKFQKIKNKLNFKLVEKRKLVEFK